MRIVEVLVDYFGHSNPKLAGFAQDLRLGEMELICRPSSMESFLARLFGDFDEANIEYAICGNYERLPQYTSNDLDIWVSSTKDAKDVLFEVASKEGFSNYICNVLANGSNNYFYKAHLKGIDLIKIDLLSDTAWRSVVPLVSSDVIQANRDTFNDIQVVNQSVEGVMHLLYPLLATGVVTEKYRPDLMKLVKSDTFFEHLTASVGPTISRRLVEDIKVAQWEKIAGNRNKVRNAVLMKMLKNLNGNRLAIILGYFGCALIKLARPQGLVIVLTGLDGAGKSTMSDRLNRDAAIFFPKKKLIRYYWRPFVLPPIAKLINSPGSQETLNSDGRRKVDRGFTTAVKSNIKYFYYVIDFILGRIRDTKTISTGGLIIFDRYHIDNIIYPERFGFSVNRSWMRWIDRLLVPQPAIIFYLTADTAEMVARKRELSAEEIDRQKAIYDVELCRRSNIVRVSTDDDEDTCYQAVLQACLERMSKRNCN